jgi:hypothetical protein
MDDRETIIETGDGGAGAIVIGLVLVVLLVVGLIYYFGTNHRGETIEVPMPRVAVGVTPAGQ